MLWEWLLGAACGFVFVLTLLTTPAGVSGAVLLLPVQVSILDVPSLAVTPTNLLFTCSRRPGRWCASHAKDGCSWAAHSVNHFRPWVMCAPAFVSCLRDAASSSALRLKPRAYRRV